MTFAEQGLGQTARQEGFGGGDYQHAYPLPDGRVLWLFQDLQFSNDNQLTATNNAAHNAGLIESGDCFTILGGQGRDVIGDSYTIDSRDWFWPLDGEIGADGILWIFMVEMANPNGTGATLGAAPQRTWLAAIDPVTLAVRSFEPAPDSSTALYGWSIVTNGGYSYLYGNCFRQFINDVAGPGQFDTACTSQNLLARVPAGEFRGKPDYWDGTTWSSDPMAAASVFTRGAANPMSVEFINGAYLSVTKLDDWWGDKLVVDTSLSPQGPWTTIGTRNIVNDRACTRGCGNYGAFLLPWTDDQGRMTIALSNGGDFHLWRADVSLYRPTFYELTLT
jgi:hypothetical protein